MRVIAGKAKGHRLQSVPGDSTRPITDRAKEALFSILGDDLIEARVLDLFGGTGAVGIEALSRGSAHATFIERNRRALQTIQDNLAHCKLADRAEVFAGDSFGFLQSNRSAPYDLIFIAPPQYQELWSKALLQVDRRLELLAEFGTVVVQIHPREDTPVQLDTLAEFDRRRYGSVLFLFFTRRDEVDWGDEEEIPEDSGPETLTSDNDRAPDTD
ncbi:MAG: 16S rRNA (guanine(966)-N(2))-methyltransferase RsmD [Litorilinea sp.]